MELLFTGVRKNITGFRNEEDKVTYLRMFTMHELLYIGEVSLHYNFLH